MSFDLCIEDEGLDIVCRFCEKSMTYTYEIVNIVMQKDCKRNLYIIMY